MNRSDIKGKKAVVVGLGRSGKAVARFLTKHGAHVTGTDQKAKADFGWGLDDIKALEIELELGRHNTKTFLEADWVIVSPGVPWDTKQLEEARAAGKLVMGELEFASRFVDIPIIAVTGTNGKTTTSRIAAEMIRASGKICFWGGNSGIPLTDYLLEEDEDGSKKAEAIVVEVSSFQAEQMDTFHPNTLVYTNLKRDHIDRHGSLELYHQIKISLMKNLDDKDLLVLNYDDPKVRELAAQAPCRIAWYTRSNPQEAGLPIAEQFFGAWSRGRRFESYMPEKQTFDVSKLKIVGPHNRENLLAACVASHSFGANHEGIQTALDTFKGVEHRLEFVRLKDGVSFFNDSMATNVAAVETALRSFKGNVIMLMGGRDKDENFDPLHDLIRDKVKTLILIGESKEKINRLLGDEAETYLLGSFEEAVLIAYQKSRIGDVVLLAPGCSSQDMFKNFEERGNYFKKLVQEF